MASELLTSHDMARLYFCEACSGCGDCCCGMGDTIHLTSPATSAPDKEPFAGTSPPSLTDTVALHEERGLRPAAP